MFTYLIHLLREVNTKTKTFLFAYKQNNFLILAKYPISSIYGYISTQAFPFVCLS